MNLFHRLAIGGALSLLAASAVALGAVISLSQSDNITFAPAKSAEEPEVKAFYWFDQQADRFLFTPGAFQVETGTLPPGFHSFHAQVSGDGTPTSIETAWFVKTLDLTPGEPYTTYFFIDGYLHTTQTMPADENGAISLALDVRDIPIGVHIIMVQIASGGTTTSIETSCFIKTVELQPGATYTTNVFIDGALYDTHSTPADEDGSMSLSLDLNKLPLGVHLIMAQVLSPEGVPSAMSRAAFLRVPTEMQLNALKLYYLIDGVPAGESDPTRSGDIYNLDVDLTSLPSGIHSLSAFLAGANGFATSMETTWFTKIPVGGEGVKSYEYWLNDDPSTLQEVVLDKVADPLEIVSLLNMPQMPFSSKRYEFAIESGKPVVYTQNDYQIRFRDLDGRFTTGSGRFTDVRDKRQVTPAGVIPDNARTRIEGLEDNEIRFYTFSGQIGDSIGVRLDGGAMWELYAPDGKTLMARSGAESVNYSSMTLTENGLFHLAIHDISSYYGNSVNIDFDHIARHAIVDFTPDESADDNLLVVGINGNGFDSLESLTLRGELSSVEPEGLTVKDNNNIYAVFDLEDKNTAAGDYRLVAKFDDEEKGEVEVVSAKTMTISEPGEYDISVTVDAPFIARTPYHIDITVENRSNRAYYGVPFNIAASDMADGTIFESLNFARVTTADVTDSPVVHTDNLLGSGQGGIYMPLVIPYLAPGEKQTYTLGLTSQPMDQYSLYTWTGTPWSVEIKEILESTPLTAETLADRINDDTFTVYDIIDIAARVAAGVDENSQVKVPTTEQIAAAADMVKKSIYAAGSEGSWIFDATHSDNITVERLICTMGKDDVTGVYIHNPLNIRLLNDVKTLMINGIGRPTNTVYNTGNLTGTRILYKCRCNRRSRTPRKGTSYQSGDPNDMHGYESPSGTRYMGLDVKEVRYTIEFENDPEIANAPASHIEIENKIDVEAYRAETLTPLSLRLGNKEIELPASHHFVRTVDMRPEIQAIAELTFDFDTATGLSKWKLRSLDPLTMDETKYMDSGILPVNDDSGRGLGFITYSVDLREGLADGTTVSNMATIIFDDNDPIDTPVWENILDYKRPTARIVSYSTANGIDFDITVEGTDAGAGIWYYDLYARDAASDKWTLVMSQIEDDTFTWHAGETVDAPQFAIVAVDHAANRGTETFLSALTGDADGNGSVDTNDVVVIINYYMNPSTDINLNNADVTTDGIIDTQDVTGVITIYFDKSGQQYIPKRKFSKR